MGSNHRISLVRVFLAAACGFLLLLALPPAHAQLSTDEHLSAEPFWPTKADFPRDQYVPTGSCESCHSKIWATQKTTSMANAAEPRNRYEITISADSAGQVTYVERFVVNLSANYDLLRFPFDSQKLILDLQPSLPDRDLVTLEKAPATKTLRAPQLVRQ